MTDLAIRVEKLGKRYRIGERAPYATLRETLTEVMRAPFRRLRANSKSEIRIPNSGHIWALKDVSFEVKQGETVGIIGRNGAGKSTLLKILCRVTEPTEGYAEIRGRVGSLLEVGTGFHPDLTGRENIYLNGAILGMKRAEIKRKFDEIVAFSEVEKFLDTPVKRYSSGMHVRLAFAVAAHFDPEILLIDEVLAVGDAAFQRKCLGKMSDAAGEGRTVVFVTHNMVAMQRLCHRGHLLEQGGIVASGDPGAVLAAYGSATVERSDAPPGPRSVPQGAVGFVAWRVQGGAAPDEHTCYSGEACSIRLRLVAGRPVREANFGIALWAADGTLAWAMRNLDYGGQCVAIREGAYDVEFAVPGLPLRAGSYQVLVSCNDLREGTLDEWYAQPPLRVVARRESGLPAQWQGLLNVSGEFRLSLLDELGAGDEHS
jgi:lipopolysaccharide transport system ATP-binding protein